jgi:hypothetical protein
LKIPHPSRRLAIAGGALAAVALAGGAVALATASSSSAVYKGCLSRVGGLLYNVQVNPGTDPKCLARDTVISWNQSGPPGVTGGAGTQGVKGDTGATGPTGPQMPPDAYIFNDSHNVTVSDDTVVISVDVPDQSPYLTLAKVLLLNQSTDTQTVQCFRNSGGEPDTALVDVPPGGYNEISLESVMLSEPHLGSIKYVCRDNSGGSVIATGRSLTVMRVNVVQ